MCGIAGYYGTEMLDPMRIANALELMRRRGPDHRAFTHRALAGNHCYLLHSRLGIIDLDPRANQPFGIGDLRIAFNGELYNYREIRREVAGTGYVFRTESDTEVLLASIARLGWQVLERCEGMWAFALWDESDGSLTLCRDRFGEKPLYYHERPDGVYFASEPKAIFALLGSRLNVSVNQLYRYLVNGYKSLYKREGETFYEGLRELPPGSLLRLDRSGSRSARKYWVPKIRVEEKMNYHEAVAGTRERMLRSVELRLRADVPIAFCMSGGVDSNSLISIAKNVFDYDVHGFTIVSTDSRYEEQDIVEQSVTELGIRHTNIQLTTRDFLPQMRELVAYHDAPVYTLTYFAHWLLMRAVAEHGYRISVSGTSADELFSGYFDHHLLYLAEIHADAELYQRAAHGWQQRVQPIVRNPFLKHADHFVKQPDFRGHMFLNADSFAQRLVSGWQEGFTESHYSDHLLRNRMLNELFHETTPVILHEDDLNAMYYSIENRSPFLDRELFDFCYRIPTRHLVRDGYAKVVLRDAMRGIVPDCVLDNPRKVGFNAPIFELVDVRNADVRASLLDPSPIFEHVRRDAVEALISRPQLPNSESKFLFNFLASKLFLEECRANAGKYGWRAGGMDAFGAEAA